jgi:hypothetical protein
MYRCFFIFSFIFFSALFFGCQKVGFKEQEVIVVLVPPFYDPNLSYGENQCSFSGFLFPEAFPADVARSCSGAGIVNDDSLLYVVLGENGLLTINTEKNGELSNTEPLKNRLSSVFEERAKTGVFEPGNWKVVKAVGIKVPLSAKYADLMQVAKAVRDSGANPIVLLLDGHLPQQTIKIEK